MTPPAAIILAAGEGRRMGGPKALLLVDGMPLIRAHAQRLREVGCDPILVVARTQAAAVLGTISSVRVIAADTNSMAASLTVGVGNLAPEPGRSVIVVPVDTLPAQCSTLRALLSALMSEGVHVATPQYRGRGGHPVAIREDLLQVFRGGYAGTLRDIVRSAEMQRRRLEVNDPAVSVDLNTPADLAALRPGLAPCFVERLRRRQPSIADSEH